MEMDGRSTCLWSLQLSDSWPAEPGLHQTTHCVSQADTSPVYKCCDFPPCKGLTWDPLVLGIYCVYCAKCLKKITSLNPYSWLQKDASIICNLLGLEREVTCSKAQAQQMADPRCSREGLGGIEYRTSISHLRVVGWNKIYICPYYESKPEMIQL